MSQKNRTLAHLRTGEEVPLSTLKAYMIALPLLRDDVNHPMAFYELVEACRDKEYVLFVNNTKSALEERSFIGGVDEDGHVRIHDDVRRVVLAATEGDGFDVRLVSPYAPEPP